MSSCRKVLLALLVFEIYPTVRELAVIIQVSDSETNETLVYFSLNHNCWK